MAGCTLNGLVFECQENVGGDELDLIITVKSCKNPAEINVQLKTSAFDWEKTVVGTESIPIPGLNLGKLGGFFLKVTAHNDEGDLKLKVSLEIQAVIVKVQSIEILDEKIGKEQCDVLSIALNWWNSQALVVKLGIGGGGGLFFLILLCCCCYCCCRNKAPEPYTVAVPPQNQNVAINTTMQMVSPVGVPYNKLDNVQY